MKKKVISTLLIAAMAGSLLAGCSNSSSDNTGNTADSESAEAEVSSNDSYDSDDSSDQYSTEIDMDEEPYTVAIQVVTLPGSDNSASLEEREEAINSITVPAINCKVEIQDVWISELANTTSMSIAGEQKIDLVAVGTVQPLSSVAGSEMLIDMNEGNLLQNRGQTLLSLFSETLDSGNVNGQQLAIPAQVYPAAAKGICYNKDIADAAGITLGDTITMDEWEEALIAVHEYDPDIYPYFTGSGTTNDLYFMTNYETFGTESSYGVILDFESDATIENLYSSDLFKDYCIRMYNWTQMGLQPGDPTDSSTAQDLFLAQQMFSAVIYINPYQEVSWNSDDFTVGFAKLADATISNSGVTDSMWGIAANCERPDKAMDFLNFLYENEEVANILKYGIEGENYDYIEGSDKVIKTNGSLDTFFYSGGNTSDMLIEYPAGEDYVEQNEALNEEATLSPLVGYLFDDTNFQTESAVLSSTITQYLPQLQNGMAASEEDTLILLDEFNAALEAAGINDVISANQEQLDAYLADQ